MRSRLEVTKLAIETSDLRSRLVLELSTGQYDCAICYSCITTKSAVWACSQCHTVLHLPCVKRWARSSVEKVEEQNAMQDDAAMRARKGTWRCPGCQFAREQVPTVYRCWDGRVQDPVGGKGVPPHSCGKPCAKDRCMHGCAAGVCHPGPCPPCPITITRRCFCGAQQISLRCSQMQASPATDPSGGVSCGGQCGKLLGCETHRCTKLCHAGPCAPCEEQIEARCYCGREHKQMRCGQGTGKTSTSAANGSQWTGRWSCERECGKLFDCGKHACKRPCHLLEPSPAACPFSPARIQTCPCGAEPLNADRMSCTDPVKTCSRTCGKMLSCGHTCSHTCHLGPCPPCAVPVTTPCRCGETKKRLPCHERQREEAEGGQEVLCQTVCRSLRLCGKHECRRTCCPLYFQAKNKSKRRPTYEELLEQDPAGYHTCDNTCGKVLTCGLHRCEAACHRGPCPPCLQASFEEMACHCGRTVLEPPVPCGTQVKCHFPCARPPPLCGHPQVSHDCHDDQEACPPCIHLVEKPCMCGKNVVANVPCHRARVSCGQTCNAVLQCGFHRCTSICHEQGKCGPCRQTCGKPRKCGHPCPEPCHAPAACPETEPCQAWVTLLCACGNIQQRVRCGSSLHNPVEQDRTLQCTDACLVAQRNAKLAEALGLNPVQQQIRYQPREYPLSALSYYGTNSSNRRWCEEMEATLTDLIRSPRHAILLHPSTPSQRQFMHDLADVFRLQSEDVDEEPRRSVAIRRSLHAQVPTPTLADAYRQHQETLGRMRPTALGPLKRGAASGPPSGTTTPGTATPPPHWMRNGGATAALLEQEMNGLLLRGVFGVDEATLTNTLRQLLSGTAAPVPIRVRWVNDEEVIVLVSDASTAKLRAMRQDIRNAGLLNGGYSRLASEVAVCLCDENGKILRIDSSSDGPSSARANSSAVWSTGISSTTKARPTAGTTSTGGGWATVAASAGAGPSARPKPSAWGQAPTTSTSVHVPAASEESIGSHPHTPRIASSSVPETWETWET